MFFKKRKPQSGPRVLYVCDRKACKTCRYQECGWTSDANHAVHFEKKYGDLFEIESKPE